jgi:hypothetical protein
METAERLVAINVPTVNEALVHASDRRHVVRVVVSVRGLVAELRADWCHVGSLVWSDVPRQALRALVAAQAEEIATAGGDLWETAQVVARYVNELADKQELFDLTGCTA